MNGTARREMSCRVRSRENSRDASPMSEKLSRSRENGRKDKSPRRAQRISGIVKASQRCQKFAQR